MKVENSCSIDKKPDIAGIDVNEDNENLQTWKKPNSYSSLNETQVKTMFERRKENRRKDFVGKVMRTSSNNSTLCLHIAAYDNKDTRRKVVKSAFLETLHSSVSIIQHQFEFMRQQKSHDNAPEVAHFKASQKLLNPNQNNKRKGFTFEPSESESEDETDASDVNETAVEKAVYDSDGFAAGCMDSVNQEEKPSEQCPEDSSPISKSKPSLLSSSLLEYDEEDIVEVPAPSVLDSAVNKYLNIRLLSPDSSSLGLRCMGKDGKVYIDDVRSGSNAEKAKLKKGDYIIAIDDVDVNVNEMHVFANTLKQNVTKNGFVIMVIERPTVVAASNKTLKSAIEPVKSFRESSSHFRSPSPHQLHVNLKNDPNYETDSDVSSSSSSDESDTSSDEVDEFASDTEELGGIKDFNLESDKSNDSTAFGLQEADEDEIKEPAAKKKRTVYTYKEVKKLSKEEVAEYELELKNTLNFNCTTPGIHEEVKKFECKYVKKGCKYALMIKIPYDGGDVKVFERDCGHDHTTTEEKKLNMEVKKFLLDNLASTPGQIQMKLRIANFPILPVVQISNFLNRERKKSGTSGSLNEHELIQECAKHERNDEKPNQCYVEYSNLGINISSGKLDFVIMFTTPHLMEEQIGQKYLQADVTFKITWMGFPLMVTGFSDVNRKFHITSISIISSENSATYKEVFSKIKHFKQDFEYIPEYLMGDGAASFTKAMLEIFGDKNRLMCYFHVLEQIKPKIKSFPQSHQSIILRDIHLLKRAFSPAEFTAASKLMIESWQKAGISSTFIGYVKKQWLDGTLKNWFTGCSDFGSTNNGVEKKNCSIKDTVTLRKRLTVRQLFEKLLVAMEVYSLSPDHTNSSLKISQEDYRLSYQYKQLKPLVKTNALNTVFYVQPSNMPDGFDNAVQSRIENNYVDWNHYMDVVQQCYFVRKANDFEKMLFCSCIIGAKKQVCKHSLAISCKLKFTSFPCNISSILIEGPRQRGRPKTAKKGEALKRN
uniref:SWIM-type domain-containing protein n=1 Tax=Panagrolaimus davidi TaxID=227884 RepID=A0A914Q532_9BILA